MNRTERIKQKYRFAQKNELKNTWNPVTSVNRNFEFRNIRSLVAEREQIVQENGLTNSVEERIGEIDLEWQQDVPRLYEKGGFAIKGKVSTEGADASIEKPWEYWSKPYVDPQGWCSDESLERKFVSREWMNCDPETPLSITNSCPYFSTIEDVDSGINVLETVADCPAFIALGEINVLPPYAGLFIQGFRILKWLPPVLASARRHDVPAVYHLSCIGLQFGYQLECYCLAKYPFLRTRSENNMRGVNISQANFDALSYYNRYLRGIASAEILLSWEDPKGYWGSPKIKHPVFLKLLDLLR